MVVQADNLLALELAHHVGHALVLRERKADAIALSFLIRRIQVEQRMRAVVACHAHRPVQLLDVGSVSGGRRRCANTGSGRRLGRWRRELLQPLEQVRLALHHLHRQRRDLRWRLSGRRVVPGLGEGQAGKCRAA